MNAIVHNQTGARASRGLRFLRGQLLARMRSLRHGQLVINDVRDRRRSRRLVHDGHVIAGDALDLHPIGEPRPELGGVTPEVAVDR